MQLTELDLIKHAQSEHRPSETFALFSGGHDSLCATHMAISSGLAKHVVHINTGVGVEATRNFVRETCDRFNWDLIEISAKEDANQDYAEFVLQHGFPGPEQHNRMFQRLKERCIEVLERRFRQYTSKPRRRIPLAFISGCRKEESTRRMGTVQPIQVQKHRIWIAPCHAWDETVQRKYMQKHDLPKNPVKVKMCMSGECLCGAYAHKPELEEWVYHFGDDPGIQKLLKLRREVMAKFPWDWDDDGPPKWWKAEQNGQMSMFDRSPECTEFLCTRCNKDEETYQEIKDETSR